MQTEDFNKTKEELKEEIKKNNKQIAISDERTRMANVSQFEYKGMVTLVFSMLPYLGLSILTAILVKNGSIASLANTIPGEVFPSIIVGGSLCIGTIGRKLLEWRFKTKERLKSFTNARTTSEKLEEEVKYAIELEKAKNRNKAIQQTIDSLTSNQTILNSLSSRYNISDKKVPQTKEESQKQAEELSALLNEKNDEIDLLTTQKVLQEKFLRIRIKGQNVMDIIIASMMGGIITMLFGSTPFILLKSSLTYSYNPLSSSLFSIFAPFFAGVAGISGYMVKRNRDSKIVFDKLNNELGENALPNKIKEAYEEEKSINAKIESKIREISIVGIQLQEQKRALESFTDTAEEKNHILEPAVAKEDTIQAPKEASIETTYTQDDSLGFIGKDLSVDGKIEAKKEEKAPSLVLRRKPFNPNDKD